MANIVYVRQPYPKWDWEAILRTKNLIWDEPFLVLFWDDIVDNEISAASQLVEAYERKNSTIISTITVWDDEVSNYWIIETDSCETDCFEVKKFLEKPNKEETKSRHWFIWKSILTPDIFDYLEKATSWKNDWEIRLADAFELMRKEKDIYWLNIIWDRYDTWSKIWFLKATVWYALKRDDLKEEFKKFLKSLDI
jgi:UTP--glucose-1-phosphate uridylyltransferase